MPTGKRKRSGGAVAGWLGGWQAVLDEQLWGAAHDSNTAEVTRLLAAGADPNRLDRQWNRHPAVVALLEAAQQGGGAGGAAADGGAAAAGATAASAASSSADGGGGAGASKRARYASDEEQLDEQEQEQLDGEREQEQLDEQLWNAAKADDGNAADVKQLLAAGANPNGFRMVRACARACCLAAALPLSCLLCGTHDSLYAAAARCKSDHTALIWASYKGHTAIVRALLGAGADLTDKDDVRPPRRCLVPAAARRRLLTRRVRRTAAQPGRTATPPSTMPARATTQRSWRCWRLRSRGAARAGRRRAAARPLLAPQRLPRLDKRAGSEPQSCRCSETSHRFWTSGSSRRERRAIWTSGSSLR